MKTLKTVALIALAVVMGFFSPMLAAGMMDDVDDE